MIAEVGNIKGYGQSPGLGKPFDFEEIHFPLDDMKDPDEEKDSNAKI